MIVFSHEYIQMIICFRHPSEIVAMLLTLSFVPYSCQLSLEFYVCTDQPKRQGGIDGILKPDIKLFIETWKILDIQYIISLEVRSI
jgi:hypothetical protein